MNIKVFKDFVIPTKDESNENCSICSTCTGTCCSHMGCHISPKELKEISVDSIIRFIEESGCVAIDWWEGDVDPNGDLNEVYYLRMRNVNTHVIDPSHGGKCVALAEKGCLLDFAYRPLGGRGLVPKYDRNCEVLYSKKQCVEEWRNYQNILVEVVKYFDSKGEREPEKVMSLFDALDMMLGIADK